jgi:hypothetical protein
MIPKPMQDAILERIGKEFQSMGKVHDSQWDEVSLDGYETLDINHGWTQDEHGQWSYFATAYTVTQTITGPETNTTEPFYESSVKLVDHSNDPANPDVEIDDIVWNEEKTA